jgi:hypothetical protein
MNKKQISEQIAQEKRKVTVLPENESNESKHNFEDEYFDSETYTQMLIDRDERQQYERINYIRNIN